MRKRKSKCHDRMISKAIPYLDKKKCAVFKNIDKKRKTSEKAKLKGK